MPFNEFKGKKLASMPFGDIFVGFPHNFYEVKEILLSPEEAKLEELLENIIKRKASFNELYNFEGLTEEFANGFREKIISVVEVNSLLEKLPSTKVFASLFAELTKLLEKIPYIQSKELFAEIVLQKSIGLKQLAFFFSDGNLEDLMVNGLNNVFVFHKEYGMCKTNISIGEKSFENIIQRIASTVGREFGPDRSLLDATMPDGSRVNATFSSVSPESVSLTIRKFSPTPLTILDLVESDTLSFELAAFLWVMVDGFDVSPKNIIVTGGASTGKTTLLNILANFIRLDKRIITIEDTRELSLLERKNWVALEAKHSIEGEASLDALLRNSLRMRPDRIIVGEVRGKEALTMFVAMDTGQEGVMGTIHSNNAREAIIRLQEPPMSVPSAMLPLISLIIVLGRHYSKGKGMQRNVLQVAEVSRMEEKVLLGNIFELDKVSGTVKRNDLPSHIIETMAQSNSMSKNELKTEMAVCQKILEWMYAQKIRKPGEVLEVIQDYYYNPEKVLSLVSKSLK